MTDPVPEAPDLPGFVPVRLLGRGGFATVYLYEQRMPKREVAVKLLSTTLRGGATTRAFEEEANLLASVSSHPAIVTIHGADISPDGHPFIVMEHCPRPNLQQRIRRHAAPVSEALRIMTQLCGAVETAHRAGILHRDIKPADVLFTSYDRPALADFGIAGSLSGTEEGVVGLSVPWAPPEAFDDVRADARFDVYALGASLYAMLAGHAPHHLSDGPNGRAEQEARIRAGIVPPIDRADLPTSLVQVIERALSSDRTGRQRSALELGRDLQRVQAELAVEQTPMDVVDPVDETESTDLDDTRTRLRAPVSAPSTVVVTSGALIPDHERPTPPSASPSRRRFPSPRVLVLIGVAAAVIGLVLLFYAWSRPTAQTVGLPVTASSPIPHPPGTG